MKSNVIPNMSGSVGILNAGPADLSFSTIAKGVQNAMMNNKLSIEKTARYPMPRTMGIAATQYISFARKKMLAEINVRVMA